MRIDVQTRPAGIATIAFSLLNPIPFGMFVGALIFDAVYIDSTDVMWVKSAAWLLAIGLLFAVIPRLINLAWVWFSRRQRSSGADKTAFFLYLLGVVAAIFNSFVHSRDALATMPTGLWLSILTVVLVALAHVLTAAQGPTMIEGARA